jgi:hypothetical protein
LFLWIRRPQTSLDRSPAGARDGDLIRIRKTRGAWLTGMTQRQPPQGCTGQFTAVDVGRFAGNLPPILAPMSRRRRRTLS